MSKKYIPGLLVDPGPPGNQKVTCSDSLPPAGACPSPAHPASSDGTPKGSAADVDGGAIVSALGQTEPSSPLVSSSVVMGVSAVTNVHVRGKESRHVKPVLPQIPVSPNAAKTEPVRPNEAATKNNVNDANRADVNDNLAEAMDATDVDGFTTVVAKNKRKSKERFAASPQRPLRKRSSDMSMLPGTPESKKPGHSRPKEQPDEASSLEKMYYTPDNDVAELAGDVESLLNVDGVDDDASDRAEKDSITSSSPTGTSGKNRKGGQRHKNHPGFKVHLPFGAAALPEANPSGALPPSVSLEPEKAKSDTSESSPPAKKQTMAEKIGQGNKERSNHMLTLTMRGDERHSVPDAAFNELKEAITKEVQRLILAGEDSPNIDWMERSGCISRVACDDEETVAWVKSFINLWDDSRVQANEKVQKFNLCAWSRNEMSDFDTLKVNIPNSVIKMLGKNLLLKTIQMKHKIPGRWWALSDIPGNNCRIYVIAADDEFIEVMKRMGFRLRAGITKLDFSYHPRKRAMEVSTT